MSERGEREERESERGESTERVWRTTTLRVQATLRIAGYYAFRMVDQPEGDEK